MNSTRRRGREAAIQFLFASDIEGRLAEGQDPLHFWELCTTKPAGRRFAEALVHGVRGRLAEIDAALSATVENYEFHRLATVDRNILRVAVYELLFDDSVPPGVAINEAIEIAKSFGGSDSGRFVNGVLDQIRRERVPSTPSGAP